ncbi:Clp protease N-terminal domain-containing protein [Nocardiopsis sp. NPDC058631]|uniref:Clp protease N-terminal domain-containing protein n=1 Tax=Nocardiopsis sp. NPDC058631 TaxID=3346566 RepID=UPI00365844DB
MFERFTEQAKHVLVLSQEEAVGLKRNHIDTEHVLLGLLKQGTGIAAGVLGSMGVGYETVLAQVVRTGGRGRWGFRNHLPFTRATKKSLEQSLYESLQVRHNFIDTEHVLLGLLHKDHGAALPLLRDLGAPPELIREQVNQVWADLSQYIRE